MAGNFYDRLRSYFEQLGSVLRGEADAASIFPNMADVGTSREDAYAEFLRSHCPTNCNVFFGGFLFDEEGNESRQMDIIISHDATPRFDFFNRDGSGKSFSCVEGTVAAASVKSTLNEAQLQDALQNISSIPATRSLDGRTLPGVGVPDYDDWPYKVIYATASPLGAEALKAACDGFYRDHPEIPIGRRPNLIHIAGQSALLKSVAGFNILAAENEGVREVPSGEYMVITTDPDVGALMATMIGIQERALEARYIHFVYGTVFNQLIHGVTNAPHKTR